MCCISKVHWLQNRGLQQWQEEKQPVPEEVELRLRPAQGFAVQVRASSRRWRWRWRWRWRRVGEQERSVRGEATTVTPGRSHGAIHVSLNMFGQASTL